MPIEFMIFVEYICCTEAFYPCVWVDDFAHLHFFFEHRNIGFMLSRSMTADNCGLHCQRQDFANARNSGPGVGAPIGLPRADVYPSIIRICAFGFPSSALWSPQLQAVGGS